MDFFSLFEDHQIEQIRRAVIGYRDRFNVGDVTLTKELLRHLPPSVSYDSTLKNVQRLRKGERMRGASFLNACIQFLDVKLAQSSSQVPPEQELGIAMNRFVDPLFRSPEFWTELAGDYALTVMGESILESPASLGLRSRPLRGIPILPKREKGQELRSFAIVSLSAQDGADYATVRERHYMAEDDGANGGEPRFSEANVLERRGVCLPVGFQDFLVMIRDFTFSHMYVLRTEPEGLVGTMVIPDHFGVSGSYLQSRYNVALKKLQSG